MTTDLYRTESDGGAVTDTRAVRNWLDDYEPTVEAEVEQGAIRFYGDFDAFAIETGSGEDVTRDALEELQSFLLTDLRIKCVQQHGRGMVAYKWNVPADGDEVVREDF